MRLSCDDIPLRVDGQAVQIFELPCLMTRAAKNGERAARSAIENADLLISAIRNVHILLRFVGRKSNPTRRADASLRSSLTLNRNIPLEVAHFVENFNPVAQPIADIHKAIVPNEHAMYNFEKNGGNPCICLRLGRLLPPL